MWQGGGGGQKIRNFHGRHWWKPPKLFHPLPASAWADGILAEVAEQVGKMVEHHESNSTQPNYPSGCPTLYIVFGECLAHSYQCAGRYWAETAEYQRPRGRELLERVCDGHHILSGRQLKLDYFTISYWQRRKIPNFQVRIFSKVTWEHRIHAQT